MVFPEFSGKCSILQDRIFRAITQIIHTECVVSSVTQVKDTLELKKKTQRRKTGRKSKSQIDAGKCHKVQRQPNGGLSSPKSTLAEKVVRSRHNG